MEYWNSLSDIDRLRLVGFLIALISLRGPSKWISGIYALMISTVQSEIHLVAYSLIMFLGQVVVMVSGNGEKVDSI